MSLENNFVEIRLNEINSKEELTPKDMSEKLLFIKSRSLIGAYVLGPVLESYYKRFKDYDERA